MRCRVEYTGLLRVEFCVLLFPPERPYCVVYITSADFLPRDALHVVRSLFELKLSSSSKSKRVSWELLGSLNVLNHCSQGAMDRLKACEVPVVPGTFARFAVALGILRDATCYFQQGGFYTVRTSLITVHPSAESK